jgi:OmcA/MtrC family decaheme c-type cytochrome
VQHSYQELALSGTLQPRRTIVSTDKCNACHGILGTTSGANTLATAFHSGARNMVEACVTCHDANRMSTTIMTNGSALNESYQFKRLIHGIHGGSERTYPFTHNNTVVGVFNKDGTSATGGAALASTAENFTAEVTWPGMRPGATINCNACHVNNSYQTDASPLGAVVQKDVGVTDPNLWKVISPKAATCTSCHDGKFSSAPAGSTYTVIDHVIEFGGATFGSKTQAEVAALPRETCNDCHANGGPKNVDIVHGLN